MIAPLPSYPSFHHWFANKLIDFFLSFFWQSKYFHTLFLCQFSLFFGLTKRKRDTNYTIFPSCHWSALLYFFYWAYLLYWGLYRFGFMGLCSLRIFKSPPSIVPLSSVYCAYYQSSLERTEQQVPCGFFFFTFFEIKDQKFDSSMVAY